MGTVAGMLDAMRELIGTSEQPPGSNHNFITEWYGFPDPWCDMTVSYAAAQSGNADVVGKFAWTPSHANWFKAHGRWHYGLGGIRPGDVVFFDWSGSRQINAIDHVGVVEAVRSDGTIVTIEGNSGDVCARRVRNGTVVVGYGRPAYDDAAPLPSDDGVLRLGSSGTAVVALQSALKQQGASIDVDGKFGPDTSAALKAFQTARGLTVDGEYGPASAAALTAAVRGFAAPVTPKPKAPAPAKLIADGAFGPATCAALQRLLDRYGAGLFVDGVWGPASRRALQRYLHVTDDGVIGPVTARALQRWVRATEDGVWGPDTTRHLQQLLNRT